MVNYEKTRKGKWHNGLNGKKWKESEKNYLVECGNSKSLKELSVVLNRSVASVKLMRRRLALVKLKNQQQWDRNELEIIKRNAGKMTAKDIAQILERSPSSVRKKAYAMGISLICVGENSPHSIHSDKDVVLCRQLRDEGMRVKLIAEKMEMSLGAVLWIIYGSRMTQQDRVMLEFDREKNQ